MRHHRVLALALLLAAPGVLAQSPPPGYDQTAASAAAQNSQPGARHTPALTIPVPTDEVSPEMQKMIAGPFPPHMNAAPKNAAEWKELINRRAAVTAGAVPML